MNDSSRKFSAMILGSFICLTLGILSGYVAQAGDSQWFSSLNKPNFNPPSWVFGPVWTLLYIMMGAALGKIWHDRKQMPWLLGLFVIQFIFNLAWSPLFFYFHRIDLALYDILLLWVSLLLFLFYSYGKTSIFLLILPYFLWVSFATVLNLNIYLLAQN